MFYYDGYKDIDRNLIKQKAEELEFKPHIHRSFELIFCDGGQMTVFVGENEYEMHNGTAVLIPPGIKHSVKNVFRSSAYIFNFGEIYLDELSAVLKRKTLRRNMFYISDILRSMFIELYAANLSFVGTKAIILRAADECLRNNELIAKPDKKDEFTIICEYMQDNFTKDISLGSLSAELGVNYSYLSRVIRNTFGMSFNSLLNDYRVDLAKSLLMGEFSSYSEIGTVCGFKTTGSFNRIFKECTGLTPSIYRETFLFEFR